MAPIVSNAANSTDQRITNPLATTRRGVINSAAGVRGDCNKVMERMVTMIVTALNESVDGGAGQLGQHI